MTEKEHNEVLQTAFDILASVAGSVRIVGEGSGRFLVADLRDHRIEFYATDHGFVVDQAIHKEVQGERTFTTMEQAPQQVLISLRLPDGRETVMTADGSIQQSTK